MEKLTQTFIWCVVAVMSVATVMFICLGWSLVISNFEYGTWNKLHGTNYSLYDWWTGSDFIKKYHYPNREKAELKEFNVNLNQ